MFDYALIENGKIVERIQQSDTQPAAPDVRGAVGRRYHDVYGKGGGHAYRWGEMTNPWLTRRPQPRDRAIVHSDEEKSFPQPTGASIDWP